MSNIASAEGIETLSRKEILVQNLRFLFVTPLIFNSLTGKQFCLMKSSLKPPGGLISFKHTWVGGGAYLRGGAYLIEQRRWYQFSIKN